MVKIEEGVYARIVKPEGDAVSNAGIVVLYDSVVVFDTHFTPEAGKELLAAVRSITHKPVRYVVNSHWHADHTHGNQVFKDANIIGSTIARRGVLENDLPSLNRTIGITQRQLERLRDDAKRAQNARRAEQFRTQIRARENYLQNMSQLKITAPFVTLDDSLVIQEGPSEVHIRFLGAGDTEGACILWLPFRKIAFVGDLVFVRAIPNVQNADILQWMETYDYARSWWRDNMSLLDKIIRWLFPHLSPFSQKERWATRGHRWLNKIRGRAFKGFPKTKEELLKRMIIPDARAPIFQLLDEAEMRSKKRKKPC